MPDWKSEIRRRLARLRLAPTRENAIVEELAQHLDESYEELLACGMSEAEAQLSIVIIPSLFIFIHLQTSSVNS
jgi:hypothetical protein